MPFGVTSRMSSSKKGAYKSGSKRQCTFWLLDLFDTVLFPNETMRHSLEN